MTFIHICLSIGLYFLGKQYAFITSTLNYWLPNLLFASLLFILFILVKSKSIQKINNLFLIVYPVCLFLIGIIIFYDLPKFTLLEAEKVIEQDTGEIISYPLPTKSRGQMGQYFIYTKQNEYIFNVNTGSYSVKK